MKDKITNLSRISRSPSIFFPFLFFFCWLTLGLFYFDDYAVFPDEESERVTTAVSFDYALDCFRQKKIIRDGYISHYRDRFYGTAIQIPAYFIEWLSDFSIEKKNVFLIRHLWVFLNVFVSQIFCYKLFKRRFGNWFIALFGVIIFILSPRLFGESFYNNKDLQFYAWFWISVFFAGKLILDGKIQNAIYLGLAGAIAANTRFYGGIVIFLVLIYLIYAAATKIISLSRSIKTAFALLLSLALFWVIITPACWANPLQYFFDWIISFTKYDERGPIPPMYFGELIRSDSLPWHYLPLWIWMTIPLWLSSASLIGIIAFVSSLMKKKALSNKTILDIFMFAILILCFSMVFIMNPIMYDGWRHFYFLFGIIAYFSLYAISQIKKIQKNAIRRTIYGLITLDCALTASWALQNHPYEMVYFNPLVRKIVPQNFAKDYWRQSSREALEFTLANDKNLRVDIGDYDAVLRASLLSLTKSERERVSSTSYGFGGHPAKFVIANYTQIPANYLSLPYYKAVKHIAVDGIRLTSVFERDHSDEIRADESVLNAVSNINQSDAAYVFDGDQNSCWSSARAQNGEDVMDLHLKDGYALNGVTFYLSVNDNEFPHSLEIFSSHDGTHWAPVEITYRGVTDYVFEPVAAPYLRLKNRGAYDENAWTICEILFHGERP